MDVDGQIEKLSNNPFIKNKDSFKEDLIKFMSNIQQCKEIEKLYKEKNEELILVSKHFSELSTLIKEQLSIDVELISELIKILNNWTNDESFAKYSIEDTELNKLIEEQKKILSNVKASIEELNISIPDMNEMSSDDLQELANNEDLGSLL